MPDRTRRPRPIDPARRAENTTPTRTAHRLCKAHRWRRAAAGRSCRRSHRHRIANLGRIAGADAAIVGVEALRGDRTRKALTHAAGADPDDVFGGRAAAVVVDPVADLRRGLDPRRGVGRVHRRVHVVAVGRRSRWARGHAIAIAIDVERLVDGLVAVIVAAVAHLVRATAEAAASHAAGLALAGRSDGAALVGAAVSVVVEAVAGVVGDDAEAIDARVGRRAGITGPWIACDGLVRIDGRSDDRAARAGAEQYEQTGEGAEVHSVPPRSSPAPSGPRDGMRNARAPSGQIS